MTLTLNPELVLILEQTQRNLHRNGGTSRSRGGDSNDTECEEETIRDEHTAQSICEQDTERTADIECEEGFCE